MYKCIWTQPDYFYCFINKVLTYIIACDINILKEFFLRTAYVFLIINIFLFSCLSELSIHSA